MGIKQIIVCDGCDKELNERKDRYYINFRTSKFLDAAGDTDYNEIDLVFCKQCAVNIKSTLNKILEKQKAEISDYNIGFCPVCGDSLWQNRDESNYCFRCGQAIDWSDEP